MQCQEGSAVVVLQGGERSAFDDEAALKAERKAAAQEAAADRLRDAYNELKYTAAGKVCCWPVCEHGRLSRIRLSECPCLAECASRHVQQRAVWLWQVADMREQEMTRMQMNLAYRTADFETARKLQSRLAPDDPFADPNAAKRLEP